MAPFRAWHSIRSLLETPDETAHAVRVIEAIDGDTVERDLRALLSSREGRRLFMERPSLLAELSDRAALAAMSEGSFGAHTWSIPCSSISIR